MDRIKESATPQDTFDHIFGSGATTWEWWLSVEEQFSAENGGKVPKDWAVIVTMENPADGKDLQKTVSHAVVIEKCWEIINLDHHTGLSENTVRECGALLFQADNADFDAGSADELLQYIMMGKVEYS